MKKSYLMIAAAAGLMLAACSQEDDFVAQNAAAEQGDGAVLFDTYLSNNSTRAGQEGIMTTTSMQKTGFGIVAMQHQLGDPVGEDPRFSLAEALPAPNFMYNQYVTYQASNWIYSPLKYWPNETLKDAGTGNTAVSTNEEGVSFFAYAPYIEENQSAENDLITADDKKAFDFKATGSSVGLTQITKNTTAGDPMIKYVVADGSDATHQPSNSVDFLWGVSSGFTYHPVINNAAIVETQGLPVINMMKPGIDEKIKFDFKHALARIGMTVIGAFDQVAEGGTLDEMTRVTIKEIKIESKAFSTTGILNLNNTKAHQALWTNCDPKVGEDTYGLIKIDNAEASEMNPLLKYGNSSAFPLVQGVRPVTQNVILGADPYTPVNLKANGEADAGIPGTYDPSVTYFKIKSSKYTPVELSDLTYASGTYYLQTATGYTKKTGVAFDPAEVAYTITKVTDKSVKSTKTDGYSQSTQYYKEDGDDYVKVTVPTADKADGTDYYPLTVTRAIPKYDPDVTYYTVNTTPGYFMVIPRNGQTTPEAVPGNVTAKVTITYYVTTADKQLSGNTSVTENIISQNVTLNNFTNGKAYNLKIILGLTSVKIDADVTNWDVETVENNLPKNLEN